MLSHAVLQGRLDTNNENKLYHCRRHPHLFSPFFFFLHPRLLLAPVCEEGRASARWCLDGNVSVIWHRALSEMLFTPSTRELWCGCFSSLISPLSNVVEWIFSLLIEPDILKGLSLPLNIDLMLVNLHSYPLSCQHLPCGRTFAIEFIHVHVWAVSLSFYILPGKAFPYWTWQEHWQSWTRETSFFWAVKKIVFWHICCFRNFPKIIFFFCWPRERWYCMY